MKLANVYAEGHSANSLFADKDPTHFYGPTYTYRLLRSYLYSKGIEINTHDLNQDRKIDFEIYVEGQSIQKNNLPKYFIAQENPNINPLNKDLEYVKNFKKVFTWNENVVNVSGGSLVMIPFEVKLFDFQEFDKRTIFSCLINGNKRFPVYKKDDLYEERFSVIEWHEKNALADFHLYGRGWQKPKSSSNALGKIVRRSKRLASQLFGYKPFPSYRGELVEKGDIYKQCKFAYCYENTKNLKNYITEKIFDSMIYGCVPIYWGAQNVTDFIPANCFVDRRRFHSQEELYVYLKKMTKHEYSLMQDAIYAFLRSDAIVPFKSETYCEIISNQISMDFQS